ncbi:uncharacterized protein BP5553_09052 [Venustampulla echinocandica]|uniref:GH16 domain-containing protein n=1 Tax=Venustampulla echinocandica TaxID=2656787 RepID=A0A370TDR1_9HELO|nr:uncharacterized protein BP5553_09052 [Venustampulla echinocandica]RDL32596.1 hypothetical protein BP5553_09052 [Venustampulla echinocandica]
MTRLTLLLCCAVFYAASARADGCTTFSINGSYANSFQYYRFYDFRSLQETIIEQNNAFRWDPQVQSLSVNDSSWSRDWEIREQAKAVTGEDTISWNYTASNVKIVRSDDSLKEPTTYLTLSATRHSSQLAAEIDFAQKSILYASIRASVRVNGASGAVAGIFTYHNDTSESDIEILTRDPGNNVHYSNQPTTDSANKINPGSSYNVSMKAGRQWSAWTTHRLDWVPGHSAWYVDGEMAASTNINVPDAPSAIILNMWSNGGQWAGRMPNGTEARLDVMWIEMAFNTSTQRDSPSGSTEIRCSVDKAVGRPTVSAGIASGRNGLEFCLLLPLILATWLFCDLIN